MENTFMQKIEKMEETEEFISFCKENEDLLLISLSQIIATMPKDMNLLDNRFDISSYYCNELERDFGPSLTKCNSIGFDMLYNHDFNDGKVSIKFGKNIFQKLRNGNRFGLTIPGAIAVRNYLKASNKTDKVKGFDYMLAVDRKTDQDNDIVSVGFGVITMQNTQKYVVNSNTDQLVVRIPNDGWDYFSGIHSEEMSIDEEKQNKRYAYGKSFTWDLVRGII